MPELSERDQAMLEFEGRWYRFAGSKESAIRELFDLSGTQYQQRINALLDDPAALAFDPLLVKRLRRLRDGRRRERHSLAQRTRRN